MEEQMNVVPNPYVNLGDMTEYVQERVDEFTDKAPISVDKLSLINARLNIALMKEIRDLKNQLNTQN